MQSSQSVPPAKVLAEAIGLGCSFGLLHAIFESTLLGLNGIRPSALDLAILVVVPVGAAALLGVCVAAAALAPPLRVVLGTGRGPLAFRRIAWTILAAGYVLVFLRIIVYWSGWGGALTWAAPAAAALAFACFAVFRKGQGALVPISAAALLAATLCALNLAHAEWDHDPATATVFAARLLFPIGLCLVMLLALMKTTSPERSFEPLTRGVGLLAALLAVWAGFWVNLNSGATLAGLFSDSPAAANALRPNILLIVLDTIRADHLDLFGYKRETMPNLKQFARQEAQLVNRTITPGSWTLPSHASMFTGLYPSAHGAHNPFVSDENPDFLAYPLREEVPTLAEFLSTAGYQTGGIVANYAMLSQFGLERGFQRYDVTPGASFFAARLLWLYRVRFNLSRSLGEYFRNSLPAVLQGRSRMFSVREPYVRRAWEINVLARQWLSKQGSRPFFLFLNYMEAHAPYSPIPEDDERFTKRPAGDEWFGFPHARYAASVRGESEFTPEEIEFMKGQYDAELVSLDRELGRLFEYLRAAELFEDTLIFITTDHGEAFLDHGFLEHGNSVYQAEIDGFLLVKTPPSLGTIHAPAPMQAVDIFPTIAAVMNEPYPQDIQGGPWGQGRDYALSEVFCRSCSLATGPERWPDKFRRDRLAVVIGNQKLIRSTHDPDEVYDLAADPGELHPLSDPDPAFMRRAEEVIAERNKHLVEELTKGSTDEDLLEKLRSLGYVQ